ncbi:signal peptidase I [Streptomyces sp. NPDC008317]|uniref:signal peptidase I n=1 Tax=Streptomyces sp. NPDC008317 TaxID=3364827 RepID=UPI0036E1E4D5
MGDLVVGARSGSGEPEKGDVTVPSVDKSEADGRVPEPADSTEYGGGQYPGGGSYPGSHADAGQVPGQAPEAPAGPADGTDPRDPAAGGPADRPQGPGGPGDPGSGDEPPSHSSGGSASKNRSFWKELPLLIGIALVLALLIKTFLVQAFSIPSDSMQHTLERGDRVLVDKLTPWFGSKPSRGEVVVFHDPGGWLGENPPASGNAVTRGVQKGLSFIGLMPSAEEKDLIKRVIGVGGDTVECNGTGPVKVNGKALDEPYVFAGNTPCTPDRPFKVTVPKGRIWVMGDHRQDSLDSRYHMTLPGGGTVSDNEVVGRAVTVAWPVNRWDWLSIPSTFSQPGINAAGTAGPAAVGLLGAAPLVLMRRRKLLRAQPPVTAETEED